MVKYFKDKPSETAREVADIKIGVLSLYQRTGSVEDDLYLDRMSDLCRMIELPENVLLQRSQDLDNGI